MTVSDKRSVLGIGVSMTTYAEAVKAITSAARDGKSFTVTALAVHGVMTGVMDREHNWRLNQFDLVCPDGQPVRWALNWLHAAGLKERVYGPELMLRTCAACEREELPIYLFGGTAEMLAALEQRLRQQFPGLIVAGRETSRFRAISEEERDQLAARIVASGARLCFVGLGCPRQEVFAYEMASRLPMPLLAVGAAFAFHAGLLQQAPAWMQRAGLEWLYRFTREPKRLWKRYVYLNPAFLTLLAAQKLHVWSAATDLGQRPVDELRFG